MLSHILNEVTQDGSQKQYLFKKSPVFVLYSIQCI